MNLSVRKSFIEIYGIFRIFIGVGQLVALCGGYFMTEFIVRYPDGVLVNVMNEELVALTYLVVILRGIFHTVTGICLAQLKLWSRVWLLGGWLVVVLATIGFIYSLSRDFSVEGYGQGFFSVIAWEKVLIYAAFIIFDFTFVTESITLLNADKAIIANSFSLRKLSLVFFITVLSFVLFIFLGRPVREGLHEGFYKRSVHSTSSGTKAHVLDFTGSPELAQKALSQAASSNANPNIRQEVSLKTMNVESSPDRKEAPKLVLDTEKNKGATGLAYGTMMGLAGGFFIVVALLYHIMEAKKDQNAPLRALFFHGASCAGFLLWGMYGMSVKLWPLTVMSLIAFILSMYIVVMAAQNLNTSE